MNTARADNAYMKLVERFPLVPLRDEAQFEEAVRVMKELAYSRASLSTGQADYLLCLYQRCKTFARTSIITVLH